MIEAPSSQSWMKTLSLLVLFTVCVMATIIGVIDCQTFLANKNRPPDKTDVLLDMKIADASGMFNDFRKGRMGEKKARLIARNDPETVLIARLKKVEQGAPAEIEQPHMGREAVINEHVRNALKYLEPKPEFLSEDDFAKSDDFTKSIVDAYPYDNNSLPYALVLDLADDRTDRMKDVVLLVRQAKYVSVVALGPTTANTPIVVASYEADKLKYESGRLAAALYPETVGYQHCVKSVPQDQKDCNTLHGAVFEMRLTEELSDYYFYNGSGFEKCAYLCEGGAVGNAR